MFAIFYDDFCYGSTFELGIVSRKLAGRRSVGYPLEVRGFSLLPSAQIGFEGRPSSYSMSMGVISLKIERPEHEAYQSHCLEAKFKVTAFVVCTGIILHS